MSLDFSQLKKWRLKEARYYYACSQNFFFFKEDLQQDMMAHTWNPSIQKAEVVYF